MSNPSKKKTKIIWRGFIIRLIILFFLTTISLGGFYFYKFYQFQQKVIQKPTTEKSSSTQQIIQSAKELITADKAVLKGEKDGRINILLLGMGGEGHSGRYLTDTIILASFNPQTNQSALLSIPRDLYVEIPEQNIFTKINAVFAYGMNRTNDDTSASMESLREVVQRITGQPVHYYAILNFDGFEKIINELDGVDVQVPEDIYDNRYPGPGFSYQTFEINQGFHHLDGATALKYARVRHTSGGDFGRASRQQQILAATKKKALSLGTILNPSRLSGFMDTLGDNFKTNIQLSELTAFIDVVNRVNVYQATNKVLDAWSSDSLLASTHKLLGNANAYVLLPRAKNYSQIQELAKNIFDLGLIERKKQSIEQEEASIGIISQPKENKTRLISTIKKLGYAKVVLESTEAGDVCPEKNILFNNSDRPKIFTLDDLATKFDADVQDRRWENFSEDVVLCLTEDALDYFIEQNESEDQENADLKDQSVLDDKGEIRVNKKK